MKIVYDENKVTLSDMLNIETGRTFKQQIEFIARFVVSDEGESVSKAEALKHAGQLSIPRAREAMREFWRYMTSVRDGAVNPPTASN